MINNILTVVTMRKIFLLFLLTGCTKHQPDFKPADSIYFLNFFKYSNSDAPEILYKVKAQNVVSCCQMHNSKIYFDDYMIGKIKTAKNTKIPDNLFQYEENADYLAIPHADAPSGVIDGGTYITNTENQCVTLLRSLIAKGYQQVKSGIEKCSPMSAQ